MEPHPAADEVVPAITRHPDNLAHGRISRSSQLSTPICSAIGGATRHYPIRTLSTKALATADSSTPATGGVVFCAVG
ncbi:MAG TPA: hypothetical protein DDW41_04435 [Candidatus Andersenbacteria bacterium]|nr:MAG: hypothetical protein A3I08_02245 [Candidatus Andersenbacteria bacterium RIFCSPLOWO2_02_FULL_46_11]HBE90427.1 hypothetical protein [Candidatus Andersenbacteria bacterium]